MGIVLIQKWDFPVEKKSHHNVGNNDYILNSSFLIIELHMLVILVSSLVQYIPGLTKKKGI